MSGASAHCSSLVHRFSGGSCVEGRSRQAAVVAQDVERVIGLTGWATRAELIRRVDRSTITAWVSSGKLVRPHPGVYATPTAAAVWRIRVESAVRSRGSVASHVRALALWGLVRPT